MPEDQYSEIKIDTIANGALSEYFDFEFQKILANIEEPEHGRGGCARAHIESEDLSRQGPNGCRLRD